MLFRVLTFTAIACLGSSCSGGSPTEDDVVRPVQVGRTHDAPVGAPGSIPSTTDTATNLPSDTTPAPGITSSSRTAAGADAQASATATAALQAYDAALSRLAADPIAAVNHPALWQPFGAAVTPGSNLLADLARPLITDLATSGRYIDPGEHGSSWRHVPESATQTDDSRISFTWCGWSPGIGRSATDGSIVDDGVRIAEGTGEIVRLDGAWRLESLTESTGDVHPAGTPDPCTPTP